MHPLRVAALLVGFAPTRRLPQLDDFIAEHGQIMHMHTHAMQGASRPTTPRATFLTLTFEGTNAVLVDYLDYH